MLLHLKSNFHFDLCDDNEDDDDDWSVNQFLERSRLTSKVWWYRCMIMEKHLKEETSLVDGMRDTLSVSSAVYFFPVSIIRLLLHQRDECHFNTIPNTY
ncbi:hypothetical protein SNEBB_010798 [Seison nebaliae]|nr:hypothetical protein SNEBB_010798 [Seison nebaliae]